MRGPLYPLCAIHKVRAGFSEQGPVAPGLPNKGPWSSWLALALAVSIEADDRFGRETAGSSLGVATQTFHGVSG